MRKLRLDLNQLQVESFDIDRAQSAAGTVKGQAFEAANDVAAPAPISYTCYTCPQVTYCASCVATCDSCDGPSCNSCQVTRCYTGNAPECCAVA